MKTLGKYEVLGEIAHGSMGVIYRARDPVLDRDVALKTIAGTRGMDPEIKERFYREARAGARLHHPNVIMVYDFGEQDGLLYMAMELLSGCDLRQWITARRHLPGRSPSRSRQRHRPPGHQAEQHISHRRTRPQDPGFRAGAAGGLTAYGRGEIARNSVLYGSRTDPGPALRCAQ